MPIIEQTPMKYTTNPTRPSAKSAEVVDIKEPRAIVSFNYVDLEWMVKVSRNTMKTISADNNTDIVTAGPMLMRLPENWLDKWPEKVYAIIPKGDSALGELYANILVRHEIEYSTISEESFKYDPDYDTIYIINTDFILNSNDVKDAIKSKTTAFDMLQKIITEKTDIFDLFFIGDSGSNGLSIDDVHLPDRPSTDEDDNIIPDGGNDDTEDSIE